MSNSVSMEFSLEIRVLCGWFALAKGIDYPWHDETLVAAFGEIKD